MNNKQLLIIDSSKALLDLFEYEFKQIKPNYHVVTASDGFNALNQLAEQPCDLIIADYDLLGMNGLEFAQAARQLLPEVHILFMSAQNADNIDAKLQDYHLPVDGCLDKIALLMHLWEDESRSL